VRATTDQARQVKEPPSLLVDCKYNPALAGNDVMLVGCLSCASDKSMLSPCSSIGVPVALSHHAVAVLYTTGPGMIRDFRWIKVSSSARPLLPISRWWFLRGGQRIDLPYAPCSAGQLSCFAGHTRGTMVVTTRHAPSCCVLLRTVIIGGGTLRLQLVLLCGKGSY
jgi:hypothetical protein